MNAQVTSLSVSLIEHLKKMQDYEIKKIGQYAASLSVIEIGLGSLLHSFSIPLSGQILSINQMAILSRASFKEDSKTISLHISLISSILKSLSPAGKKLTPMLAILAQGLLFSSGLVLFGVNSIGLIFAIIFSSAWAFIQPLLILYFLFGKTIIDVLNYFKKDFSLLTTIEPLLLLNILILSYIIKTLLIFYISRKFIKMSEDEFQQIQLKLNIKNEKKVKKTFNNQLLNALRDLFQPIFIVSFVLTAFFLYFSKSNYVNTFWTLLRPLAIGLLLFYVLRVFPVQKFSFFFKKKGMVSTSKALQIAIDIIKEKNN